MSIELPKLMPGTYSVPGQGGTEAQHPFQVTSAGDGMVKIFLHSMLMRDIDPTSKITITGLDAAFPLSSPNQYIWLEVDITALYDEPPGDITAAAQHGAQWGEGKNFWPLPVEYNTSDGKRDTAVGAGRQDKFFVPIAYTVAGSSDPFAPVGEQTGLKVADGVYLVQQLRNHLVISRTCFKGDSNATYVSSFHAPFPTPDNAS